MYEQFRVLAMALRGTVVCIPMLLLDRSLEAGFRARTLRNSSHLGLTCYDVTIALCCYDYALTLDREVAYMWRSKQSFATLLFYTCRYSAILNTALELLTRMAWPSWQSDKRFKRRQDARRLKCTDLNLLAADTFSGYKWDWIPPYWSLQPYVFTKSNPALDDVKGYQACELGILGSQHAYENTGSETGMIGARAASVVSDGLVLVLTCIKTWQPKGLAEVLVMDIGTTIREILLKDRYV
ncbi:hypothetical protein IEO21_06343 [Rhodonia placenta]|uniref:DUF6533 domain-containing protein n=1 Tax=Rhodonia placenta TaxID=104341 RepID=A0A8H7U0T7_9APHY|nr:hypothetical protein IEO21_06343 [Postia placenta]